MISHPDRPTEAISFLRRVLLDAMMGVPPGAGEFLKHGGRLRPLIEISLYDLARLIWELRDLESERMRAVGLTEFLRETQAIPPQKDLTRDKDPAPQGQTPRPFSLWGEDLGDVLWTVLPVVEPPYCGVPGDSGWPFANLERAKLYWLPLPEFFQHEGGT